MATLSEAIARFRSLTEVKVGDYVTTKDGYAGHVQSIRGNKIYFEMPDPTMGSTDQIWTTIDKITVNPGEDL